MMLVPTYVAPSAIHGLGLFAREPIAKGTRLWEFRPGVDIQWPQRAVDALPEVARLHWLHHGYVNPRRPGYVVLCADYAMFWNFAEDPNAVELLEGSRREEAVLVAARDIAAGEELTVGFESDADADRKLAVD